MKRGALQDDARPYHVQRAPVPTVHHRDRAKASRRQHEHNVALREEGVHTGSPRTASSSTVPREQHIHVHKSDELLYEVTPRSMQHALLLHSGVVAFCLAQRGWTMLYHWASPKRTPVEVLGSELALEWVAYVEEYRNQYYRREDIGMYMIGIADRFVQQWLRENDRAQLRRSTEEVSGESVEPYRPPEEWLG